MEMFYAAHIPISDTKKEEYRLQKAAKVLQVGIYIYTLKEGCLEVASTLCASAMSGP